MAKPLSICISTHEYGGKGAAFLKYNFDILIRQTFKDFDIVVSDQSANTMIEDLCNEYKERLDIHYYKEPTRVRGLSVNINNAIRNATGTLIKIIFLDDFLYHDKALENVVKNFDVKKDNWLVTACNSTKDAVTFYRNFYPTYDDKKILFKNTISSPSVVTIKNEGHIWFDEKLIWWMDTDFYKRCYEKFGMPKILDDIDVTNRMGPHQVTNTTATEDRRESEWRYMVDKYKMKHAWWLKTNYKINRYWRALKNLVKKILGIKK